MKIFVKLISGDIITIESDPDMAVAELAMKVFNLRTVSETPFNLYSYAKFIEFVFGDSKLQFDKTLADYKFEENTIIQEAQKILVVLSNLDSLLNLADVDSENDKSYKLSTGLPPLRSLTELLSMTKLTTHEDDQKSAAIEAGSKIYAEAKNLYGVSIRQSFFYDWTHEHSSNKQLTIECGYQIPASYF